MKIVDFETLSNFKPLMIDDPEEIKVKKNFLLISGRVGGKTVGLIQKIFINLHKYQDRDIQILRANSSSLSESIFLEIKKFCFEKLPDNVFKQFKWKSSPPLKIKTPYGNEVRFSGVGLGAKSGSNISRGKTTERKLSLIVVEETQEIFSGMTGNADLLNHALATYLRYLDDNIGKIVYAGNRERNINAKFNVWAKSKEKDKSFTIIETNWLMIRHWLNRATIQMIETEKELNPKNYEYMFMGIPVGGDELVYGAFTNTVNVIPKENIKFDKENPRFFNVKYGKNETEDSIYRLFIGVDGSSSRDKTSFMPIFNTKQNKLIVKLGDSLVHDPKKRGIIRNVEMASKYVSDWFYKLIIKYRLENFRPDQIFFVVDGHNVDLIENLRFYLGNSATIIKFTRKDLIETTAKVNNAFTDRVLYVVEEPFNELLTNGETPTPPSVLFNELETVCWSEDKPDKFNDAIPNDMTDSIRYPVAFYADAEHIYNDEY